MLRGTLVVVMIVILVNREVGKIWTAPSELRETKCAFFQPTTAVYFGARVNYQRSTFAISFCNR